METQLIENIAMLLRQEGFTGATRHKSSTSTTLTAEHDGTTVVVHVSEGSVPATSLAVQHSQAPKGLEIMMKASLPGMRPPTVSASGTNPLHGLRQGSGGGGKKHVETQRENPYVKEL